MVQVTNFEMPTVVGILNLLPGQMTLPAVLCKKMGSIRCVLVFIGIAKFMPI